MKWKNAYVLCLQPNDYAVRKISIAFKTKYNLPVENCFSLGESSSDKGNFTNIEKKERSLEKITILDKLIICGHGNPDKDTVGNLDYEKLSSLLKEKGLDAVGLVSFKSCKTGRDDFLDMFKISCDHEQIKIGWLIGYKDTASFIGTHALITKRDRRHLLLNKIHVWRKNQTEKSAFYYIAYLLGKKWKKDSDSRRIKVVKGNTAVNLELSDRFDIFS